MRYFPVVTALILALFSGSGMAADSGRPEQKLIAQVIDAYGGSKALANVRTVFASGHISAFMQGDEGTSTRWFQRPRKLRAQLVYNKSAELRIINGKKGWRSSNGKPPVEVIGPPFLGMVYQYKYLDLPFGFLDNEFSVRLLPRETLNGRTVDVLQLSDQEGPPMRLYIDGETHLIARVAGSFSFGSMGTELAAEFSDFRTVAGVKFPFTIVNYGGDNKIAETRLDELRLNQEMPDSLFQP